MEASKLGQYFSQVITSESVGCTKPDKRIFEHAMECAGVRAADCLMIGDSLEADILGAKNAGIDQVFFNPERRRHAQQVTYEISCLSELQRIL